MTQRGQFRMSFDNVWEGCSDHWHRSYARAPLDDRAWLDANAAAGSARLVRGGSWDDEAGEFASHNARSPADSSPKTKPQPAASKDRCWRGPPQAPTCSGDDGDAVATGRVTADLRRSPARRFVGYPHLSGIAKKRPMSEVRPNRPCSERSPTPPSGRSEPLRRPLFAPDPAPSAST